MARDTRRGFSQCVAEIRRDGRVNAAPGSTTPCFDIYLKTWSPSIIGPKGVAMRSMLWPVRCRDAVHARLFAWMVCALLYLGMIAALVPRAAAEEDEFAAKRREMVETVANLAGVTAPETGRET